MEVATRSREKDQSFSDPAWSYNPQGHTEPWTEEDNTICKALYLEVCKAGRLTCDWLPYGYRGQYKAIYRADFLSLLFGEDLISSKTASFIHSKLLGFEGNSHYPIGLFFLINKAKWIVKASLNSQYTWYQAGDFHT